MMRMVYYSNFPAAEFLYDLSRSIDRLSCLFFRFESVLSIVWVLFIISINTRSSANTLPSRFSHTYTRALEKSFLYGIAVVLTFLLGDPHYGSFVPFCLVAQIAYQK